MACARIGRSWWCCALVVLVAIVWTPAASGEMINLSGYVYCDANYTGTFDGLERGLAGIEILLRGVTADEQLVELNTVTDSEGLYCFDSLSFADLQPGVYSITEVQPEEFVQGRPQRFLGTVNGVRRGTAVGSDSYENILLSADCQAINYNFGEWGIKAKYISKRSLIVPEPSVLVVGFLGLLAAVGYCFWRGTTQL